MGVARSRTRIYSTALRERNTGFTHDTVKNPACPSMLKIESNGLSENYTSLIQIEAKDNYELYESLDVVSNTQRLIKVISKEKLKDYQCMKGKSIATEVEVLRRINHTNIQNVLEIYEDSVSYYLVFENTHAIPLSSLLSDKKTLPEKKCSAIMSQLLTVLDYCHSNSVVHRDIHPDNILILKGKIFLTGFSQSSFIQKYQKSKEILEKNEYSAPELSSGEHNQKCDLWSCGILLFKLIYGRFPHEKSRDSLVNEFSLTSKTAMQFIKQLLNTDYRSRASAFTALTHHFIVKYQENYRQNSRFVMDFTPSKTKNPFRDFIKSHIGLLLIVQGDVKEQKEMFDEVNEDNNNNSINKKDLRRFFKKTMNDLKARVKSEKFMKRSGETNSITFERFIECTVHQRKDFKERVQELFRSLLTEHKKTVTVQKIYKTLCAHNSIDEKEWKKALKQHKINMEDELGERFFLDLIFL